MLNQANPKHLKFPMYSNNKGKSLHNLHSLVLSHSSVDKVSKALSFISLLEQDRANRRTEASETKAWPHQQTPRTTNSTATSPTSSTPPPRLSFLSSPLRKRHRTFHLPKSPLLSYLLSRPSTSLLRSSSQLSPTPSLLNPQSMACLRPSQAPASHQRSGLRDSLPEARVVAPPSWAKSLACVIFLGLVLWLFQLTSIFPSFLRGL